MTDGDSSLATVVAFLRRAGVHDLTAAEAIEHDGALAALETLLGAGTSLFADGDLGALIASAARELARWEARGIRLLPVTDQGYPERLRTVHDRPALLFLEGDPELLHMPRAVALVGSRHPSAEGLAAAAEFASEFAEAGYVVISGLAAGVDGAAHRAALTAGGRTVAVIGTGLDHAYPPAHAALQAELAREHAVVSPFWPESGASADNFRRRNGVMSGLGLGTVIVEASHRSGTRVQARLALTHGRPVFLRRGLLAQSWAAELADRAGVHVVDTATQVLATLARLHDGGALTEPCG